MYFIPSVRTCSRLITDQSQGQKICIIGVPLNRLQPDRPGTTKWGDRSRTFSSMIKGARVQPSGKRSGQKGADGHLGTISVPFAPVCKACLITLGIRNGGGQSQL